MKIEVCEVNINKRKTEFIMTGLNKFYRKRKQNQETWSYRDRCREEIRNRK